MLTCWRTGQRLRPDLGPILERMERQVSHIEVEQEQLTMPPVAKVGGGARPFQLVLVPSASRLGAVRRGAAAQKHQQQQQQQPQQQQHQQKPQSPKSVATPADEVSVRFFKILSFNSKSGFRVL